MKITFNFLFILLLFTHTPSAFSGQQPEPDQNIGTISGQLVDSHGQAILVGVVSFFDSSDGLPFDKGSVRRIPNHVIRLDPEGKFKAELPVGSYYLGALQRARGVGPGPPRAGEKFFFILNDEKSLSKFAVISGIHNDIGQVSGAIPDLSLANDSFFTVEGTLLSEDGQPFANAFVTVKRNLNAPRPLFISNPSSADGHYVIKLPPGEGYYLMAVQDIRGGRPELGSYIGSYGGQSPDDVQGKDKSMPPLSTGRKNVFITGDTLSGKAGGTISNINITMYKMLDPAEIRQLKLKEAKTEQPFALEPNTTKK